LEVHRRKSRGKIPTNARVRAIFPFNLRLVASIGF